MSVPRTGTPKSNRWDKFWTNLGFGVFLNAVRGKRVRNERRPTCKPQVWQNIGLEIPEYCIGVGVNKQILPIPLVHCAPDAAPMANDTPKMVALERAQPAVERSG